MTEVEQLARQSLANDLAELADRFRIEADAWQHPAMTQTRRELEANRDQLDATARTVAAGGLTVDAARAMRDAGQTILRGYLHMRRRLDNMRRNSTVTLEATR